MSDSKSKLPLAAIAAMPGMPFQLLTEPEAASLLRISQRQLQRLVDAGKGPPRTEVSDRRITYLLSELMDWVRKRTKHEE